jgi:hypothetical protein
MMNGVDCEQQPKQQQTAKMNENRNRRENVLQTFSAYYICANRVF